MNDQDWHIQCIGGPAAGRIHVVPRYDGGRTKGAIGIEYAPPGLVRIDGERYRLHRVSLPTANGTRHVHMYIHHAHHATPAEIAAVAGSAQP